MGRPPALQGRRKNVCHRLARTRACLAVLESQPGKFRGTHRTPKRDSRAVSGARQMDCPGNAGSLAHSRTDATRASVLRTRPGKAAEKTMPARGPWQIRRFVKARKIRTRHKKQIPYRKTQALKNEKRGSNCSRAFFLEIRGDSLARPWPCCPADAAAGARPAPERSSSRNSIRG